MIVLVISILKTVKKIAILVFVDSVVWGCTLNVEIFISRNIITFSKFHRSVQRTK